MPVPEKQHLKSVLFSFVFNVCLCTMKQVGLTSNIYILDIVEYFLPVNGNCVRFLF